MEDCHTPASAKPADLRKAELRRHPCTHPNKGQVQSDCLSGQGRLLQQQSHTRSGCPVPVPVPVPAGLVPVCQPAAFLLGHCPPPAVTPGGAEVTLRADPVAVNKSEGLRTEEPQLHSDPWQRSRRLSLSQSCSSSNSDFRVFFQYFHEFFAVFLSPPSPTSPENSLKFIFYPLSF